MSTLPLPMKRRYGDSISTFLCKYLAAFTFCEKRFPEKSGQAVLKRVVSSYIFLIYKIIMKKSLTILLVFVISFLGLSTSALAQKYGYINFNNLIVEMPDAKKADAEIETYRKQQVALLENKAKALEAKFKKYLEEAATDDVSPKKNKEREAELQKDRQEIGKFEQEVLQKIQVKREKFYDPIFKKANDAINQVAKENGYSMIFNESIGILLYNEASEDIMAQVKAKLGM